MTPAAEALFDYEARRPGIRPDLAEAHRRAWRRLAAPGTWWTGAERVALAAEARAAEACDFCRARREALSPFSVDGAHDRVSGDGLPDAAVDAVHRIVTDATRLDGAWVARLAEDGVSDAHYVELLGLVACLRSVDVFHRAMGWPLEPLPEPLSEAEAGPPSRRRPPNLVEGDTYVPILPARKASGEEADLFPGPAPYVLRALSLVPDAVRWLKELSAAHYLPMAGGAMLDFVRGRGPLSRAQTELIAGRVSALNECFY